MRFYPSKNNDRLNRRPFAPEAITGTVMVNPRYPITELAPAPAPWWCAGCEAWHPWARARVDSGAFQDIMRARLFPWTALEAQLRLEERLRWYVGDEAFHFDVVFIYDQMAGVDEAVVNGKKVKVRGTRETAERAVQDTLEAAAYYAAQRHRIVGRIGWVGQGIDPDQYLDCIRQMMPMMRPGDVFGFGGFCIWGRMPKRITPVAHETISRAVPLLKAHGITEFHLLGVMYAPGIAWAAELARREGVVFATDGSGPEQAACISGRVYDADGRQRNGYAKHEKFAAYHPRDLAHQNIRNYHEWISTLEAA